ncbi:hypothetical protein LAG90_01945 [Marinilongibacter aquaticus]|uniref:hypothetical protein n=1 Tax=Marinilongibacter aquaticus TaxID=2975157 RepID=UPI0021BDA926|nr:hypothetical protein [Marinilongibacter aquaticus]UBM59419.1 hypothetical protein LAG90_01945 [Marinilongibacter aquaticus]
MIDFGRDIIKSSKKGDSRFLGFFFLLTLIFRHWLLKDFEPRFVVETIGLLIGVLVIVTICSLIFYDSLKKEIGIIWRRKRTSFLAQSPSSYEVDKFIEELLKRRVY